jgi:hypothetical protein
MLWQPGSWADCRDPAVFRVGELLYLYYTGSDANGGIIGVATAEHPAGPWQDWGAVMPPAPIIPESPTLFYANQSYYLFFHYSGGAEAYRIGASPAGPWTEPYLLAPGWGHEVWADQSGQSYTSYLTSYAVTIAPLTWNQFFDPPRPFIGGQVFNIVLPLVLR